MKLIIIKRTIFFLSIANCILLCAGWIMSLYAYPRLPEKIVVWLSFSDIQSLYRDKSALFFVYPLSQSLLFILFFFLPQTPFFKKNRLQKEIKTLAQVQSYALLKKEFIYLVLIFFNLVFIHLERSIILVSHGIEKGVSELYFFSLFGIILLLIPYYRIRTKLFFKGEFKS